MTLECDSTQYIWSV